jgi:hypothetical protein
MYYAALARPTLDRVYSALRRAGHRQVSAVYEKFGLRPGFEHSFYFGLLARPMPADALGDALAYTGVDMTDELAQGTAEQDADGAWRLTALGRELALAVQREVAAGAEEFWASPPIATMPGLAGVPRLVELVGRLLDAGQATGGPAFRAVAPVYEPAGASPVLRLTTRLGAFRHHRADAHRAAWRAAGLTAQQIRALPDGPQRQAVEDDTNRRDEPVYSVLSPDERLELLAGLAGLPG